MSVDRMETVTCYVRSLERVLRFHNVHCFLQRFGLVKPHDDGFSVFPILGTLGPRPLGALLHSVNGEMGGGD